MLAFVTAWLVALAGGGYFELLCVDGACGDY